MDKFISSLGQVSAIIGAQWGDEGKGKATDLLAEHFDVIARASGGANAGHTIYVKGQKHIFHLLPSGCFHADKSIVLGAGMAIHLPTLLEEIDTLQGMDIDILDRLYISPAAHIVFDYHKNIDAYQEEQRSAQRGNQIGTTKRGIGPAYMDKAARTGIRLEQLRWSDEDLRKEIEHRKQLVESMYDVKVDVDKEMSNLARAKEIFFKRLILNIPELLHMYISAGQTVLIEGAQATLLDIDHGTYPFVTSSSTTVSGALQGLGLNPRYLTSCIGVAKAYCTRVGKGDFVTEAEEEAAQRLRERGGEFGSTTGRPRRCGWLYIPDLHYASMLNGYDSLNITKLDVLDEEAVIPVGIGFNEKGEPVYEELPGWQTPTTGIKQFDDLPKEAQGFISFLEENAEVKVSLIGTGPEREDMILKHTD